MNTRLLFLLFMVWPGVISCSRDEKFKDNLVDDCVWDILDKGSPHPIHMCLKFSPSGACEKYHYRYFNKKRTNSAFPFDEDDVVVPEKWKIIKDSIVIRANKYFVIKLNPDSVFLTAVGTDTTILIRNCETTIDRN